MWKYARPIIIVGVGVIIGAVVAMHSAGGTINTSAVKVTHVVHAPVVVTPPTTTPTTVPVVAPVAPTPASVPTPSPAPAPVAAPQAVTPTPTPPVVISTPETAAQAEQPATPPVATPTTECVFSWTETADVSPYSNTINFGGSDDDCQAMHAQYETLIGQQDPQAPGWTITSVTPTSEQPVTVSGS